MAAEGAKGLRGIRALYQGRGPEPRPLPEAEGGMNPVLLGALGKGF